jgi:hypothetical protein
VKHFIAFGNADQESFRSEAVRRALDYMTVPGTIAAYYPDGTAGFVLSSGLNYIIDPRTPLFQGEIDEPRASHYSLAESYGPTMASLMGSSQSRAPVSFQPAQFGDNVIREMVDHFIRFQRGYAARASSPKAIKAFDKYQAILQAAGRQTPSREQRKPPSFVLAPYFVATSANEWADINMQIWAVCSELSNPKQISPVVAAERAENLESMMAQIPEDLSRDVFYWVPSFQERRVSTATLMQMRDIVRRKSHDYHLVNLYGGFYSICLSLAGLEGFSNGLGYSESRDWPELSATGASPARYYVRALHQFATPGVAELIVRLEPQFRCGCDICLRVGDRLLSLSYAELKQHFANARRWELDLVASTGEQGVREHLEESAQRMDDLHDRVPARTHLVDVAFLRRWAEALSPT